MVWVLSTSTCRRRSSTRTDPAADLRAVGRQLPAGHAGVGAAASRHATGQADGAALHTALAKRYAGSKYVSVTPLGDPSKNGKLEPEALNESNMLELYVFASEKHRQAVLVARLDNLGKGASGAAVQNMRLMLGLSEA